VSFLQAISAGGGKENRKSSKVQKQGKSLIKPPGFTLPALLFIYQIQSRSWKKCRQKNIFILAKSTREN